MFDHDGIVYDTLEAATAAQQTTLARSLLRIGASGYAVLPTESVCNMDDGPIPALYVRENGQWHLAGAAPREVWDNARTMLANY